MLTGFSHPLKEARDHRTVDDTVLPSTIIRMYDAIEIYTKNRF
jgi:hypothetical protein